MPRLLNGNKMTHSVSSKIKHGKNVHYFYSLIIFIKYTEHLKL